jgi:hypothetical protein
MRLFIRASQQEMFEQMQRAMECAPLRTEKEFDVIDTILGKRFRWFQASTWHQEGDVNTPQMWQFNPVFVGPDFIEYTLVEGPHVGRHAIQRTVYHRVAPGIESTAWCEESGGVIHITWYLESQTSHRFRSGSTWLLEHLSEAYAGSNQDPEFVRKVKELVAQAPDDRRYIGSDDGFFELV